MLDIVLRDVRFRTREGFALHGITAAFERGTHTALAGPPACGASMLLALVAGTLRPEGGDVILGQRRVNDLRPGQRPVLFASSRPDVPARWSVEHALVAAVRTRSLDREDRRRELELAADRWALAAVRGRTIRTLSSTERTRLQLARIDLMRPAVLLADRVLEGAAASDGPSLADAMYRALRVHGTTVLSVPASRHELALTDRVVVLEAGRIVQSGAVADVFARPLSEAAALATGEADLIPVTIRGTRVESVIGAWDADPPPFQGSGVAVVRPGHFAAAAPGEESDLIFGIEEAGFSDGVWIARGLLSGGIGLRVALPAGAAIHKGRLMALRYDPARFTLLPREVSTAGTTVPTDVVPPLRETR